MLSLASRIMVVGTYEWRHYSCSVCALARDARTRGESGQDSSDRRRRPKPAFHWWRRVRQRNAEGRTVCLAVIKKLAAGRGQFSFSVTFFSPGRPLSLCLCKKAGGEKGKKKGKNNIFRCAPYVTSLPPHKQPRLWRGGGGEPSLTHVVQQKHLYLPRPNTRRGGIEEGSRRARCVQGEKDPSAAALSRFALWFPCFSGIKGWGKESERTMCAASSSVSLGGLSGSPTTGPRDERETFPNANPLSPPALRRTF